MRNRLHVLNAAWFAIGELLWKLNGFVVLAVVSRRAPEAQASAFVLAQTILALLTTFGDLGFRAIGTRLMVLSHNASQSLGIYKSVQSKRLIAGAVVGVPIALMASIAVGDSFVGLLVLIFLVACWYPYFAFSDWAFLGLKSFRNLTILRSIVIFFVAAGIVISLAGFGSVVPIGAGYFFGFTAASLIAFGRFQKLVYARGTRLAASGPLPESELAWRPALLFGGAFALNAVFHAQEVVMSGSIFGEPTTAVFAASLRIIVFGCSINWLLTQFLSPYFVGNQDGFNPKLIMGSGGVILCGALLTLLLWLGGDKLCALLYGHAFEDSGDITVALSGIVLLDAMVALLGTWLVMQSAGRASAITIAIGCAASVIVFTAGNILAIEPHYIPVIAKYSGYGGLLLAQLIYVSMLINKR